MNDLNEPFKPCELLAVINKLKQRIDILESRLTPTVTKKNSTDINEDLNISIYKMKRNLKAKKEYFNFLMN